MEPINRGHLRLAFGIGFAQQVYYLIQLAHQGGQVALDNVLIVKLRLLGAVLLHVQYVSGGLVQFLVQGLHFAAQAEDLLILRACFAVDPLAQHAGVGGGAACELRPGIQGVAEVSGPFVMGRLRLVAAVQQVVGLGVGFLGPVGADDVNCDCHAEHQHGNQRAGHPNPYASLDALTHDLIPLLSCIQPDFAARPAAAGR